MINEDAKDGFSQVKRASIGKQKDIYCKTKPLILAINIGGLALYAL